MQLCRHSSKSSQNRPTLQHNWCHQYPQYHLENPTKQLADGFLLVDVSLQDKGKEGEYCVIDFSIITSAAESYCEETTIHSKAEGEKKINKYASEYKEQDNTHFFQTLCKSKIEESSASVRKMCVFKKMQTLSPKKRDKLHTSGNQNFLLLLWQS